jgi:uncharacterized protein with WD repeat
VEERWDFFISYTSADRAWAEWIAWELESATYKVLFQAWDFVPGSHWTSRMGDGIARADRTLAILSHAYLKSVYGRAEWEAAYRADPNGFTRKLIPVRVEDCPRPDLLDGVVSFDLFDQAPDAAQRWLLDHIRVALTGRAKPTRPPAFPTTRTLTPPQQPSPTAAPTFPPQVPTPPAHRPVQGTLRTTLTGHTKEVGSVVFSPDGATLATASYDRSVRLWDLATREQTATLTGHTGPMVSVVFSPDGATLATASADMSVRLWDLATREQTATLTGHTGPVRSVVFSPDGATLATASWDETVRLWDLATRTHTATLAGHTAGVWSVVFSPDGATLATASWDETVRLWDLATRTHTATLAGHTAGVWSVVFSPDGATLATASYDETVRLWDLATREQTATLTGHTDWVWSVVFSPDGATLATASHDTVRLWDLL